jgi:four helix bundle protein
MAQTVEELKVWQRATELCDAVDAIIEHPRLVADQRLRDQIRDAADSVLSNIAEGFEQASDRGFVRYLYISKGSAAELRTRLYRAHNRRYITEDEYKFRKALTNEVGKMLTGLIKYLIKSDRKRRGLGQEDPTKDSDQRLRPTTPTNDSDQRPRPTTPTDDPDRRR